MERETIIFSGGRSMKGTVDKLLNFMKLSDDEEYDEEYEEYEDDEEEEEEDKSAV